MQKCIVSLGILNYNGCYDLTSFLIQIYQLLELIVKDSHCSFYLLASYSIHIKKEKFLNFNFIYLYKNTEKYATQIYINNFFLRNTFKY